MNIRCIKNYFPSYIHLLENNSAEDGNINQASSVSELLYHVPASVRESWQMKTDHNHWHGTAEPHQRYRGTAPFQQDKRLKQIL